MTDKVDDFKRGYATAARWVFIGEPDNYKSVMLNPGDPIPPGAKSRPWFLGQDIKPVEAPVKPEPKPKRKRKTTKKKSSSSSEGGRASKTSGTKG